MMIKKTFGPNILAGGLAVHTDSTGKQIAAFISEPPAGMSIKYWNKIMEAKDNGTFKGAYYTKSGRIKVLFYKNGIF